MIWSIFWIVISVIFGVYLYYANGSEISSLYFAGYILEKSLSVDNLFVMMAIFTWFGIPEIYRHRVLYFGIIGAIIFRLIFLVIGASLFAISPWVEMIFAVVIIYTAILMIKGGDEDDEVDYSNHLAYRLVYRFFPVVPKLFGHNFFVKKEQILSEISKQESENLSSQIAKLKAIWIATPLFLCL